MVNDIKSNKGFTLVELILALAIFSLLVVICGMIMSKVGVVFSNVYNQAKFGATSTNIVAQVRSEMANASDVKLLPVSADYSPYMTFDSLCKDDSGNLIDFKGRSTAEFEVVACDKNAGLTLYHISCDKASSAVSITKSEQYHYSDFKSAVPIIKFKKNTGAPDTLQLDVRLYQYDETYIDDGTVDYRNPDGTNRAYYYGLNTQLSFQNSTTIKAAVSDDVYVRALVFRIVE